MTRSAYSILFTQAQRKVIAALQPAFAERLKLDVRQSRAISFTAAEVETIHAMVAAEPNVASGIKRNSLRRVVYAIENAIEQAQGIGSIPAGERLYQFKIALTDSQPPIWRRIQVKNCTLDRLHACIQTAMGWTNSHLHQFTINENVYGDFDLLRVDGDLFDWIDSTATKISEIVPSSGQRFRFQYLYDFGDSWEHEVLFEGCLRAAKGERYPLCVEGERACPPEDCGGIANYTQYAAAFSKNMLPWQRSFDPEQFDPVKSTKRMRRGLPDWRQMQVEE